MDLNRGVVRAIDRHVVPRQPIKTEHRSQTSDHCLTTRIPAHLQEILTGTTERTINHDTGKNSVDRGVGLSAHNLGLFGALVGLGVKVASERF